MSILMNFIVVSVYWPFLHAQTLEKHKDSSSGKILHFYLVHSFPAISCLINSICTNCVLNRGLWKLILSVSLLYHLVNYSVIYFKGIVMYHMLNFRDGPKTYLWIVALTILPISIYNGLCKIDESIKWKLVSKKGLIY